MNSREGSYPERAELRQAADRFHALLNQYGPPPETPERLPERLNRMMPLYAVALVGGWGILAALLGWGAVAALHARPGMVALCALVGVTFGLLTRRRRWSLAYVFGAALFASRGLLPWECLWNAVKHYRLAAAMIGESHATLEAEAALQTVLAEKGPRHRRLRRKGEAGEQDRQRCG